MVVSSAYLQALAGEIEELQRGQWQAAALHERSWRDDVEATAQQLCGLQGELSELRAAAGARAV